MTEYSARDVIRFLKSTTGRLALTYVAIIMLMSIGFSIVFYNTSSHQLGRQVPPSNFYSDRVGGSIGTPRQTIQVRSGEFDDFFQQRINEGRHVLLGRLVWLNILALLVGSGLSYALARRTLQPIEDAMEAQSRFVSDASHELRTPITALQTTNEVALRKPKLSIAEAKDLIQHNVAEAAKLKTLSDGLLGLLKQGNVHIKLAPTSLQDVVSDAMNNIVTPAMAKNITINDNVAGIKVLGNKQTLTQLVTILLDNAIKYSDDKSAIHLDATTKSGNGYLSVRDEGIGIHASDIPHIFERFYRADRSRTKDHREGYGLGLSIAHKIAEQHNGTIVVESTPGQGSTFTIKIPLAKL